MKKRLLSLLLVAVMVVSMLPMTAMAADTDYNGYTFVFKRPVNQKTYVQQVVDGTLQETELDESNASAYTFHFQKIASTTSSNGETYYNYYVYVQTGTKTYYLKNDLTLTENVGEAGVFLVYQTGEYKLLCNAGSSNNNEKYLAVEFTSWQAANAKLEYCKIRWHRCLNAYNLTTHGGLTPPAYTVTYNKGAHGTLAGDDDNDGNVVHTNLSNGVATPAAPQVTADEGYYFVGWSPEVAATVTDNATYTAQYAVKAAVTITGASDTKTYSGLEQSVTTYTTTGLPDGYTVSGVNAYGAGKNVGAYTVAVTGTAVIKDQNNNDVTNQFSVTMIDGTLTIAKRNVTLTSASDTKEYDGTPLTNETVTVGGDGWVEDEGAAYDVTGSQLTVGSSANTFGYTLNEGTSAENYNIQKTEGTLTVTDRDAQYEITVEANSGEFKYDGTAKTVEGFKTLNFTVGGVPFTVSGLEAKTTATDAGTYEVKVTGTAVVKDAEGNDVTDQFIVKTENGTLTIAKRLVTLTSGTSSREYNGEYLTNSEVTVTGDGFAQGEGATYTVTGKQLLVGSSTNTFIYTLNENTNKDNYTITEQPGQLTVTNRNAKYEITVVANSDTVKYDGSEHSVSGFETLTFEVEGNTYTVEGLIAGASATNAGSYTANVEGTAVVKDEYGNNVTAQFAVTATAGTLTITKRAVTLTSATDSKQYDGNALTNSTVTVSGDGWARGEGATYTVTGSQTLVGSSENYFTYTPNDNTNKDNYTITTINGTLTVTNRDAKYQITVVANSGEFQYDGTERTVEGFKTLTFEVAGNTYTVEGLTAEVKATDAGKYPVNVVGTPVVKDVIGNVVTDQFAVSTTNGEMTIAKRQVTLTSASAEKEYDGKALTNDTVTVSGDGFVEGEGATYIVTGSQTLVGSSDNAFTYTLNKGTKADNYEIETVWGTLEVTNREKKFEITVEANSDTFKYDGMGHSVSGFKTLKFEFDGVKFTVEGLSASVSGTDAGTYTAEVTGTAVVRDADGNDVTAQFIVKTVDGTLTINKRQVTLTSATDSKQYDGTPLTNDTVTVSGDDFAEGEGATYTVTGSQLIVGSSANEFTYKLNAGTNADNYVINVVPGTLNVTNRNAKYEITVVANSDTVKYDGSEHSVSGFETLTFTLEANGQTYTVEGLSASASGTEAGIYTANVTGTAIVKDAYGNDVSSEFSVGTQAGTLTITKREVTLTSATDSKEYDGKALTNDTVTVSGDGWADGEGATYTVTGSQTLVGSSKNYFTYALNDNTKADNYNITTNNGTLTVVNRDAKFEITMVANSATKTYDGSEQTVTGFVEDTFTFNGVSFTVSGLTAEGTGTDAGTYTVNVSGTAVVKDTAGNDVTGQFAVSVKTGTLTINKRIVNLKSESADKAYDGTALTAPRVTITGEGFVAGEVTEVTAIGSIIYTGWITNYITITKGEGFKDSNYEITKDEGILTVTALTDGVVVTITGHNASEIYDGTEKSVEGFDVKIEDPNELYTVNDFKFSGEAVAKRTERGTTYMGLTADMFSNGNIGFDKVTFVVVDGYITVNLRDIEITKTVDKTNADVGQTLKYTITVSNPGDVDFEGVKVSDALMYKSGDELKELAVLELYNNEKLEGEPVTAVDVKAGEEVVLYAEYKLTYADQGKTIVNTAVAEAEGDTDETKSEGTDVRIAYTPKLNKEDHVAYIIGYEDETVRPQNNITRAEVATIFFRLLTDESRAYYWSQTNDFSDVDGDDWYNNAVSTMANAGVLTGYPDGTFRPNEPITRAEFAAIAARFSDVSYNGKCSFTDVSATHWAADEIALAEHLGWITGYEDNTFKPGQNITRAEAMTLINRVLERAVEEEHMLPDMVTWIDNKPSAWYYEAVQEATNSHEYTRLSKQVPGQSFNFEDWIEILLNPDWAALEKSWSDANDH